MFDKLIVSEPEGAEFRSRRGYFMVSSLAVGILFITAVVVSIYAADYGLGTRNFELTTMLAPVEMAAVAPEPVRPQPRTTEQTPSKSAVATRQVLIDRVDSSTKIPSEISTAKNTNLEIPRGPVVLGPRDTTPDYSNAINRDTNGAGNGPSLGTGNVDVTTPPVEVDPPREVKPPVVKPPVTQSLGVINGKATSLPKPIYSPAAKAVGASGAVNVQVSIDEDGRVTSANAVSGHPLLRAEAEKAARNARFSPTYLSNVKVKVTGVIVYNFVR